MKGPVASSAWTLQILDFAGRRLASVERFSNSHLQAVTYVKREWLPAKLQTSPVAHVIEVVLSPTSLE